MVQIVNREEIKSHKRDYFNMGEDVMKDLKDTEQEVMLELKLKTSEFLKKLKEQTKKNKIRT